jgi:group II intron reverse transcriptase/maturase
MNEREKSDGLVVPAKLSNKDAAPSASAETVEGRSPAKGNAAKHNTRRTLRREQRVPSGLARVRQTAARDRKARFTALLHHVTIDRLRDAFKALKRRASPGVDGLTWGAYAENLESHLVDLHGRIHRGSYRAKPARRAYIPKSDGRSRSLGMASLEDKIVQRAVGEVLQAIYEVDFLGFSYGFRPGRNQHHALDALAVALERRKVNWILDADIRGFFDAIDHEWLTRFVEHRIGDPRVLRLIQKWLSAGVVEDGRWRASPEGTPQGATMSPLLANVFLHYAFDLWAHRWRKKCARGDMVIVRYADDFVVGFQRRDDADRFLQELRKRLECFKLELHPDKTRMLEFGRYAHERRIRHGLGKPETFDFLGFTHICGRDRRGRYQLLRKTSRRRMTAKLQAVKAEVMFRRHRPIPEQGKWLGSVVRGYFAYHAIPNNNRRMSAFRARILRMWLHALRRRSQKSRETWQRMNRLATRWIPPVSVQHPWPGQRFDARTQGRSPVR